MSHAPLSLRNIPTEIAEIADAIARHTGLSLADVYRLALGSGVLVEATKITPDRAGSYAGLDGAFLAHALRRHLGSAIDLLVAYGEHPAAAALVPNEGKADARRAMLPDEAVPFDPSLGDDLESLGLGLGLSQQ